MISALDHPTWYPSDTPAANMAEVSIMTERIAGRRINRLTAKASGGGRASRASMATATACISRSATAAPSRGFSGGRSAASSASTALARA